MNTSIDELVKTISNHQLFLRLKNVIEHYDGWHHHEPTYDHSLKTARIAKRELEAAFIKNEKARELFLSYMKEQISGVKRGDIAILAALLHDCGKLLSYKEGSQTKPMLFSPPGLPDFTLFPGHEYWGASIVTKTILADIQLPEDVKQQIANIVRCHGIFNDPQYFTKKEAWPTEAVISDVKGRGEGLHIEALFNSYCDCFDASAFAPGKTKIMEIFNTPYLYTKRSYFIA
jgi:hypothetical protein